MGTMTTMMADRY